MSFKVEITRDDSGRWETNRLRFASREAAETYMEGLKQGGWSALRDTRIRETDDAATDLFALALYEVDFLSSALLFNFSESGDDRV